MLQVAPGFDLEARGVEQPAAGCLGRETDAAALDTRVSLGERPVTSRVSSAAAVVSVSAPKAARGGLLYTARFEIEARRDLKHATLLLDPGWIDGMQVNSTNPQPGSRVQQ